MLGYRQTHIGQDLFVHLLQRRDVPIRLAIKFDTGQVYLRPAKSFRQFGGWRGHDHQKGGRQSQRRSGNISEIER